MEKLLEMGHFSNYENNLSENEDDVDLIDDDMGESDKEMSICSSNCKRISVIIASSDEDELP